MIKKKSQLTLKKKIALTQRNIFSLSYFSANARHLSIRQRRQVKRLDNFIRNESKKGLYFLKHQETISEDAFQPPRLPWKNEIALPVKVAEILFSEKGYDMLCSLSKEVSESLKNCEEGKIFEVEASEDLIRGDGNGVKGAFMMTVSNYHKVKEAMANYGNSNQVDDIKEVELTAQIGFSENDLKEDDDDDDRKFSFVFTCPLSDMKDILTNKELNQFVFTMSKEAENGQEENTEEEDESLKK